jgi:hypothetical protein
MVLDDSIYGYNDDWETDYNMPLIEIGGMTEIEKEDGSIEKVAISGNTYTFTRTEHADPSDLYIISVGKYGTVILSDAIPSANLTLPSIVTGEVKVSLISESATTITGKFITNDPEISGPYSAYALLENGSRIDFTTGEDGAFTVFLPVSTTFELIFNTDGYICPGVISKTQSSSSKTKDIGELEVRKPTLGGNINGFTLASSTPGDYKVGYDVNDGTVQEGEYVEVKTSNGGHHVAINSGAFGDFDVSFSLVRYKDETVANETDPGFGLYMKTADVSQQLLFHRTGVRNSDPVAGKTEIYGLMTYDTSASFGVAVDFRIVRRGSSFLQYYKLHNETEWNLIRVQRVGITGKAGLFLTSTNSKYNHYIIWNVVATELNDTNIPQDLLASVVVNESTPSHGSVKVSGGTEVDGNLVYALGDTLIFDLKPNQGYVLATAKVNGEMVTVNKNKFVLDVTKNDLVVDIAFEPQFETRMVKAKILAETTYRGAALPSKVNVVATLTDGRQFIFDDVAVASDGSISLELREGTHSIYAYTDKYSSKPKTVTVSEHSTDLGDIALDVMRFASVTANGVALKSVTPNEKELFTQGITCMPSRNQTTI